MTWKVPPELDADEVSRRFEAHVSPLRDALEEVIDVAEDISEHWGHMPSADSPAMAELAGEVEFDGPEPWGAQTVQATYNLAGLLITSANDCARSVITLLRAHRTPIYSHVVLTRSCLEQAGRALVLLEPAVGTRIRVARGMNERLFGLREQRRMPLAEDQLARSRERERSLLDTGASLDMEIVRTRGGELLCEDRPGQTEVLRGVFELPDDRGLGEAVYGMFSAVAHGTSFGLSDSVSVDAPEIPTRPGVTMGAVFTSSGQVVSVLCALALGWGQAIDRRIKLFGWLTPDWSGAWLDLIRVAQRSMPSPEQG